MDKSFEADQAQIEQLIKAVQYENIGAAPLAGSRQPGVLEGSDNVDISRNIVHTGWDSLFFFKYLYTIAY